MRRLAVIAIGLFLMSAGQLYAQTADPFAKDDDPFGPLGNAARRGAPADSKPVQSPKTPTPNEIGASRPTAAYPSVRVGRATAVHERIEGALRSEAHFDYLDQPLKDVVEDISYTHKIPIVIDTRALEDYGIDTGTPITKSLKGISLRSALKLTLRELELTIVIRDEVLQITTPESAAFAPGTRFYHVAELLPSNGDGKVLVELIKTLVAPATWCGSDSVGSIIYIEHLESLAIRQTDDAFYEIEELLAMARQLAKNQRPVVRTPTIDPFE